MVGSGTIVNVIAVLGGAAIGMLIKGGMPKRFQKTIMSAIGLCTFFIGITGALSGMMTANKSGGLDSKHIMLMILCLVLGGIIGEILKIEDRLDNLGGKLKKMFKVKEEGDSDNTFVEGFVTSTLLFCVGAMAIVGSLEDGLNGNATTLYAKSILDCIAGCVFASSLGAGVFFSVIPLAVYQGGITALSTVIKPYLTDMLISQMSFVGSILIFALGINLIFGKKIRLGNLLPAMFMPILFMILAKLVPWFGTI